MALALGYTASGFVLAGFSEPLGPLFAALMLFMWYRTRNRMYLAAIVGIIIGILIVAFAPGNAVRAQRLSPRRDIITGMTRTFNATVTFIGSETITRAPALVLAFLVGCLCPSKIEIRKRRRWAALLIPLSLATIAFTLFVPLYFAGGLEQRHFTSAAFILVITIFILGVLCAGSSRLSSSS